MRNAESVAVFWDLPDDPTMEDSNSRLCLHFVALSVAGEITDQPPEVLILHHEAGHAFVPLSSGCERYRFTLGWDDGLEFRQIAMDEVEMPIVKKAASQPVKTEAVEGHGFHPLAMAAT